jgi:predicted transcriptional regulator
MKIQELIAQYKEAQCTDMEVASKLGVSQPMVSQYKKGYNASLEVARKVYKLEGIVLYPFSEQAVRDGE